MNDLPDLGDRGSCSSHDDCVEDANDNGVLDEGEDQNNNGRIDVNGRCTLGRFPHCTYDECFTDEVCGGFVCLCEGGRSSDNNVCMRSGNCQTNADCGAGGYCSPSQGSCGNFGGIVGFFCHTAEDLCTNDSDCGPDPQSGRPGSCRFTPESARWECQYSECVG